MVSIKNILNFCNLLMILCYFISVIDNYIIITTKYVPLVFIVNTFNLFICFFLIFLKLYPDKIDIDINEYIINCLIQFTIGLFILGLSIISIGIGILSILNSLFNLFCLLFNNQLNYNTESSPNIKASK